MVLATWELLFYGNITTVIPRTTPIIRCTFLMNPGVAITPVPRNIELREKQVNHANVFQHETFKTALLPYYDKKSHGVNVAALNAAITALPYYSIVVFQVCGNNPTGCDLSSSEWSELAGIFVERSLFAFLDVAYMGFVTGDAEADCAPIHLLAERGVSLLVAATYGKCFGLYGERVGHLCITAPDAQIATRLEDQMKLLARAETGAQPRFGARIVSTILGDSLLKEQWKTDLISIARQLSERRLRLKQALEKLDSSHDWAFLTEQKGMFA